jgi:hypothetical protein
MTQTLTNRFRIAALGAAAGALLLGSPMMPVASAQPAHLATAAASTYGGTTSQGFPVIADVNATHRLVVRVLAGVELSCTPSNTFLTVPDGLRNVRVSKKGRFAASFGPQTTRNDDGTTTDLQGRITGHFNKARTQVAGTWRLTLTDHDATGAVTDTCDTAVLTWRAKQ